MEKSIATIATVCEWVSVVMRIGPELIPFFRQETGEEFIAWLHPMELELLFVFFHRAILVGLTHKGVNENLWMRALS